MMTRSSEQNVYTEQVSLESLICPTQQTMKQMKSDKTTMFDFFPVLFNLFLDIPEYLLKVRIM